MIVEQNPFEVKLVEYSISDQGVKLPTFHLKYPRYIHSELMTHRDFSRNARSSRAVPTNRLLKEDPFMPYMMGNRPGMQSTEELPETVRQECERVWYDLARYTQEQVTKLYNMGVHKQWVNRPLEWFGFIHVLVTSTNLENFFALRCHRDAQPEIKILAELMKETLDNSKPKLLIPGQWHLPYVTDEERRYHEKSVLLKLSTARCARISYEPFDGDSSIEAELNRFNKLMGSFPMHASPAEHQATPDGHSPAGYDNPHLHGNFYGWVQHRKLCSGERVLDIR